MKENQDEAALDSEFRQVLYFIKLHINHIDNYHYLESYRVWLERLSSAHPREKRERNQYLMELADQIRGNVLKPPFTHKPPKGSLPPFTVPRGVTPAIQHAPEEISEHFFQKDSAPVQWPYLSPRRSSDKKEKHKQTPPAPVQKNKSKRPFQNIGKVEDPRSDSSSWCDLTDTTVCGDADGDSDGKKGICAQTEEGGKREGGLDLKKSPFIEVEHKRPSEQEVEALKMRMKDLVEVKNALRDTHFLTQDRKKTIENLEKKLEEVLARNKELEELLKDKKQELVEVDAVKSVEVSDFKQKFSDLRQKEIDCLKQYHADEITSLEKAHGARVAELEAEIESLKKNYEEQIRNVQGSNVALLKMKDEELERMRRELRSKTSEASSNKHNEEQVIHLKNCISKLDKMLHKNEKEFVKRIKKLEHELEIQNMASQVQLQTQRADIVVRTAAAQQEDVRNAFNSLEAKYKKMMESVQMHALEAKRHDERVIEELKEALQKNNIPY